MSQQAAVRRDAAGAASPHVAFCETLDGLDAVRRADVELAICNRAVPARLARWLDALPPHRLPNVRFETDSRKARLAIEIACAQSGLPLSSGRRALAADAARLVRLFERVTRCERVLLRLEAVSHDACRKFHVDNLSLRLLTTYRGPGTEWRFRDPTTCPPAIHRLEGFAVGLFKGHRFDAGHESAIVHRSPPIAGTGVTRLLLCLSVAGEIGLEP